ncbi:hypothetical protein PGIGA_G00163710 [Pangasianodon gigas]|uniref:Uncharacterized protein n=1 Tax=Pangasianodon gigas TaxID=30993 RepID=A0ACC5XS98_PANGG|nr:hypothetical protein [Pangasianodon gigas]
MSAQAQMRAMLDQLMGTGRDGDTMRQRIKFTDERVCKSHLLESCPHDILSGTRMDLGECLKVHDLALRADYEIASKHQEYFFELDAAEHLQSFIADCDRRTELAKKRLAETQEEISAEVAAKAAEHLQSFIADCDRRTELAKKRLAETQEEISAEVAAKAERVHELNEEIGKLLARAEQLGGEGNVEEAQQVLEKVVAHPRAGALPVAGAMEGVRRRGQVEGRQPERHGARAGREREVDLVPGDGQTEGQREIRLRGEREPLQLRGEGVRRDINRSRERENDVGCYAFT